MEENKTVAEIYMLCRRQYVTAEEGRVVSISIPAIKITMDLYGVKDQKECLERIIMAFYHFENIRQQETK